MCSNRFAVSMPGLLLLQYAEIVGLKIDRNVRMKTFADKTASRQDW
jgi:hypothetical protein